MSTSCPECGKPCAGDSLCCPDCIAAAGHLHSNAAVEFAISARGRYPRFDPEMYITAFTATNRVTLTTLAVWGTIVVIAAVSLLFMFASKSTTQLNTRVASPGAAGVAGSLAAPAGDSINEYR